MPSPMTPPPTMAMAHFDFGGPSVGTISPRTCGFIRPRDAREDAERRRLHRRARGERQHHGLVAAVGDRAQPAGVHHALLAFARPRAEAGVALHLFDRLVAERDGVLHVGERHVFAAADDRLGAHASALARPLPEKLATTARPQRAPADTASSMPPKPVTSPQANTCGTALRPSSSTRQWNPPPAVARTRPRRRAGAAAREAGAGSAATATRSHLIFLRFVVSTERTQPCPLAATICSSLAVDARDLRARLRQRLGERARVRPVADDDRPLRRLDAEAHQQAPDGARRQHARPIVVDEHRVLIVGAGRVHVAPGRDRQEAVGRVHGDEARLAARRRRVLGIPGQRRRRRAAPRRRP